jgi:hypothetical protein
MGRPAPCDGAARAGGRGVARPHPSGVADDPRGNRDGLPVAAGARDRGRGGGDAWTGTGTPAVRPGPRGDDGGPRARHLHPACRRSGEGPAHRAGLHALGLRLLRTAGERPDRGAPPGHAGGLPPVREARPCPQCPRLLRRLPGGAAGPPCTHAAPRLHRGLPHADRQGLPPLLSRRDPHPGRAGTRSGSGGGSRRPNCTRDPNATRWSTRPRPCATTRRCSTG